MVIPSWQVSEAERQPGGGLANARYRRTHPCSLGTGAPCSRFPQHSVRWHSADRGSAGHVGGPELPVTSNAATSATTGPVRRGFGQSAPRRHRSRAGLPPLGNQAGPVWRVTHLPGRRIHEEHDAETAPGADAYLAELYAGRVSGRCRHPGPGDSCAHPNQGMRRSQGSGLTSPRGRVTAPRVLSRRASHQGWSGRTAEVSTTSARGSRGVRGGGPCCSGSAIPSRKAR